MQNDDFYRRHDDAKFKSREMALNAALAYEVDASTYVNCSIPSTFGERWAGRFFNVKERLVGNYQGQFDSLITLAGRSYLYSIVGASSYMHFLYEGVGGPPDELSLSMTTPEGYADSEGWANTLFNGVCAEIGKPSKLLHGTPFDQFPNGEDLLSAMAIVWFLEAARIRNSSETEAMNLLFEASDALDLANGLHMWSEGSEHGESELNPAAVLAKRRHAENYAMIDEALKYWRENIDPAMSASKAANELVRVVPLSHKKLAQVIAAEKKKQP